MTQNLYNDYSLARIFCGLQEYFAGCKLHFADDNTVSGVVQSPCKFGKILVVDNFIKQSFI